ncbi:MAG: hypothetical protein WC683_06740 [bacterium]
MAPTIVKEAKDPCVEKVHCCGHETGMLFKIQDKFVLIRDDPNPEHRGRLATVGCIVAYCRGNDCYADLYEKEGLTFKPWVFGRDTQVDDHLRLIARQVEAMQ